MPSRSVSRRDFARQVALGTASLPLAATALITGCGAPPQQPETATDAGHEQPKPTPEEGESKAAAFLAEAALLRELIKQRYPDGRISAQVLAEIGHEVQINLLRAAAMARVPLANTDEPAFGFAAYRSEASK